MRLKEAIAQAGALRPHTLEEETLSRWLYELDGQVAELMESPMPEDTWPEDRELMMPAPKDGIYPLYLCAQIDNAMQDTDLYANDMVTFNAAYDDAAAWWRRGHCPQKEQKPWGVGL